MPKKIGMKKAVIMPRNWPWIWSVRMGDSPISTPGHEGAQHGAHAQKLGDPGEARP